MLKATPNLSIQDMRVLIVGDFCPRDRVSDFFERGDFESVLGSVKPFVSRADYAMANLECPIATQDERPIVKQGPTLKSSSKAIDALRWAGFSCVTLANNHFLDYGETAVEETLLSLDSQSIEHIGGGRNLKEASAVLYKDIDGLKIAILNCCEHEFSVAAKDVAGSNPLDPIGQYYQIQEVKSKADYVIMIVHGGVEHFQYPTKRMVQTYRFFIDAGADAVINHHQHCPCGYEVYNGKPIYYGLGNFCFDWECRRKSIWNMGYMVNLNLTGEHHVESDIIPFCQCDDKPMVEPLKGEDLKSFNEMMTELCEAIKNNDILDTKLAEFNVKNDFLYRKMLEPYSGRLANSLYRRGILPSTISKDRILALMDFIVCESHYERVKEFLERQYKRYINE